MLAIGMVVAELTLYSKVIFDSHFFLATCDLPWPGGSSQFFREPEALEPGAVGSYLEGRDVATCAFHSDMLPALGAAPW